VRIERATGTDCVGWAELRHALWPDANPNELLTEAKQIAAAQDGVCFLLTSDSGVRQGFIEASLSQSSADQVAAHVEGWYVAPAARGKGHGRALLERLEDWCLRRSVRVLTSDTTPTYPLSRAAHERAGFRVAQQITVFVKDLRGAHGEER